MADRPADKHPELPVDPDALTERGATPPLGLVAILLVALGGLAGTLARYGLAVLAPTRSHGWPWGTQLANIVGAFVLGLALEWLARHGPDDGWRRRARLLIGTGFCGALTTYSSLAVEVDLLVRGHDAGMALGYLISTLVLGLAATVAGIALAAEHHRHRAAAC